MVSATRKLCPTGDVRPPVLRTADLGSVLEIVHKENPVGMIVSTARPVETGACPGSQRRAHRRHQPESIDVAGPRTLPEAAEQAGACVQPPNRTARRRGPGPRHRDRLPAGHCAPASHGRPRHKSCTSSKTSSATCAGRERSTMTRPCCWTASLNNATEVDVDCLADGETVFIGVMGEQAGVHSSSACSLPPYSLSAEVIASQAPDHDDGQGSRRQRPDERCSCRHQGGDVCTMEVNPRLAYGALRVQGHRSAAQAQNRRAPAWPARRWRHRPRSRGSGL